MQNQLVSVIIPVYNADDKLNRLVKSILNQTYQPVEVIIADDNSTDSHTLDIELSWTQKDSRVKVFKNEVNGERYPRLFGVRHSKGAYVTFSDQDDWLPKDSLQKMMDALQKYDADVVVGQISKTVKIGPVQMSFPQRCNLDLVGTVIQKEELMDQYYISYFGLNKLPVSAWGKLYKRSLFERAISDLEEALMVESEAKDLLMSLALHPYIDKLCVIKDVAYSYYIGVPGVSPKYLKVTLPLSCNLFSYKWKMIEKYNYHKAEFYLAVEMMNYVKAFIRLSSIYDRKNRESYIALLGEVLQNTIWEKVEVLLNSNYKDKILVEWVLAKDAKNIFQKEESLVNNASLTEKIKYFLLRNTLRFKS